MVRIDVKALKSGIHEYDWDLQADQLELDPHVFTDLELHVRMDYHPSRIFVTMTTHAIARLICDRTLVEFDQPIQGEYSVLFSGPEFFEGNVEEDEDIRLLTSDMEEIDLTDAVRDTFLLALPQRRIAPGAEDTDIPLQFGAPENGEAAVDPRWEVLKGLLSEDNGPNRD